MMKRAAILGLTSALLPVQAIAAPLATGGGFELPLLRIVLGFLFCAMVAVLAAIALKRGMITLPTKATALFTSRPREIQVRESRRVSPHADVCAIGWRGRDYLIVVCAGGAVTVLETRDSVGKPSP